MILMPPNYLTRANLYIKMYSSFGIRESLTPNKLEFNRKDRLRDQQKGFLY